MAATTAPSKRPSDAEWSLHLPRICDLYYGQRFTLEDTQSALQQETGFYATLRMYKDRIRNMAVHPKKISMEKYQAMGVVAEDFQRRGIGAYFVGPSGFQMFRRTPAQITKQLRRPHNLRPITLDQAHMVLQQSSIQAIIEHTSSTAQQLAISRGDRSDAENSELSSTDRDHLVNRSLPESESEDSNVCPHFESGQDNFLAAIDRSRSYSRSSLLDVSNGLESASTAHAAFRHERPANTLSLAGVNLLPDRLWDSRSSKRQDDSYDFTAEFRALSMSGVTPPPSPLDRSFEVARMLPPPTEYHRRRIAIECAAPFFLPCFPTSNDAQTVGFSKSAAMERFRYILTTTPENQYVLPLLNWMSTVLVSNGKSVQLKDFVDECCQVLHDCPENGFPLSTPYFYLQAFCNQSPSGMAFHGSDFAAGTERLTRTYGPSHPNVLVNEYYRAWHEMSLPFGWAKARTILEACLSRSETVMGHCNLMTINCLAMLGRGCSENNLYEEARSILTDIVQRLDPIADPLQAYRLMMLQRLADVEEQLGSLDVAEKHRRAVYEGRLLYLTAINPETKAAMCSLAGLLRNNGRRGEAQMIEQHYDQVFQQQCKEESSDVPTGRQDSQWPTHDNARFEVHGSGQP
jgi:hypothetical protein